MNLEPTNRCNAGCITCPREVIGERGEMSLETFEDVLSRVADDSGIINMVNLSGYGEGILHRDFFEIIKLIEKFNRGLERKGEREIKFALVTNGQGLNREKLEAIEGVLDRLSVSFGTINPENYRKIHRGLDYNRVVENIKLARKTLDKTRLVLHLTPTRFTMGDIEPTVKYWREQGIREIVLFPFTFNRAGNLQASDALDIDERRNTELARRLRVRQLESVFVPGFKDLIYGLASKDGCLTKSACLYIDWKGNYHYCVNDIRGETIVGNVKDIGISEAVEKRREYSPEFCQRCNMGEGISRAGLVRVLANSLFARYFS